MDDAVFDSLMAEMDTSAAPVEAEASAAAPEADASPTQDEQTSGAQAPESDVPATAAASAPAASDPQALAPEPEITNYPEPPAWDSPENPHYQAASQFYQLQQALQEAQRIQAQQQVQQTISDLADGDVERMQQITGLLAQTAGPLRNEVQQLTGRTTQAEKAATAMLIAMQNHLPQEQYQQLFTEIQTLMNVDGPEVMERVARTRTEAASTYKQQLAASEARIKELELQVAARAVGAQRDASGADRVDAGVSGAAPITWYDRATAAKTEDDYFDALFSAAS